VIAPSSSFVRLVEIVQAADPLGGARDIVINQELLRNCRPWEKRFSRRIVRPWKYELPSFFCCSLTPVNCG